MTVTMVYDMGGSDEHYYQLWGSKYVNLSWFIRTRQRLVYFGGSAITVKVRSNTKLSKIFQAAEVRARRVVNTPTLYSTFWLFFQKKFGKEPGSYNDFLPPFSNRFFHDGGLTGTFKFIHAGNRLRGEETPTDVRSLPPPPCLIPWIPELIYEPVGRSWGWRSDWRAPWAGEW